MEIISCIIIGIISLGISFVIKGLVDKFTTEDEKIQEYLKQFEDNDEFVKTKEFKQKFQEFKRENKVKLIPKFNLCIAIVTIISIVSLYIFRDNVASFIANSFLMILLIIAMFADIKACIIPDEVNIAGLVGGLIFVAYNYFTKTIDPITHLKVGTTLLIGGALGFTIFFLIGCLGYLVFKKEGMGGGDIKLMGVIGLFMGIPSIIQVFILSFFVAAIISVFLLITRLKKRDDYIPFGPFIVIATFITMFISGSYTYNQIYRFYLYK